jgi:ABC-type oligopeptide transport system substrate-binding subunit
LPSVNGHYNFDTIRIDYYKDDSVARQALFAGAYDVRREANANIWQRDYTTQKIVQDKKLLLLQAKHQRPEPAKFLVFNQRVAPFDNVLVRQALVLAFDASWFNNQVLGGAFTQIDSIFPNSNLADPQRAKPAKKTARQNLQQATKLLAQAGWVVDNNVLVNAKTKQPMQFEILLNDAADEKVALHWQRGLKRLGVQTTIRTVDTAEYTRRLSDFDFTVAAAQWRNSLSPGSEQKLYWGCQAANTPGSFNYAGVCLPVAERAMHQLTAATTRGQLVQAAQSLDKAVMASIIGVPLFYQGADHMAYKPFLQHPAGKTPLYGPVLETWWAQ